LTKATKRAMAAATRVASNDKGDGNGDEGGRRVTAIRVMVVVTTVVGKEVVVLMAMRVVSNKEGEGSMAMARVKKLQASDDNNNKEGSGNCNKGG
jgi:hypothetical protein